MLKKEVSIMPPKTTLPDKQTRAYELLELVAIFGEFPNDLLQRISGGLSYKETIITNLKQQGFIKTHYADGLRGLRLTNRAKKLLLADNPERFAFYMDENSDTNHVRSEPHRRERLYRIAGATVTMQNAGVAIFRDERPAIFTPTWEGGEHILEPSFYSAREVKDVGFMFDTASNTRITGVLLTKTDVFITYNLGNSIIQRWSYKTEMRAKAVLDYELTIRRLHSQYDDESVKGLILANSMELAAEVLRNSKDQYFLLNDNFEYFYFVTNDEKGEMLLRLLCNPDMCSELDEILLDGLYPADDGLLIENDAITDDGKFVLLAYKCDLRRIRNFDTGLALQKKRGVIYCFDYQADVLRWCCSGAVEFKTLDYKKTERRFFS